MDIISYADIILCTKNSKFSIKEVDLGIVADLGSFNNLNRFITNQNI